MTQQTIYAIGEVLVSIIVLGGSFVLMALFANTPASAVIMPVLSGLDLAVVAYWFSNRSHANEAQNTQSLIQQLAPKLPNNTNASG